MNVNSVTWVIALSVNTLNKSKRVWLEKRACSMYRRHTVCSETQKVESERMRNTYKQQAQESCNRSTKSFKMDCRLNKVTEIRMSDNMKRWLIHQKIIRNICASNKAQKQSLNFLKENWMIWYRELFIFRSIRGKGKTRTLEISLWHLQNALTKERSCSSFRYTPELLPDPPYGRCVQISLNTLRSAEII